MKKVLALVLSLALVVGVVTAFAACGGKEDEVKNDDSVVTSDIAYIKEKGKMVIGITEYAPMNYKDENGNWTGFDTEFAEAVCKKIGKTPNFIEINWDTKFPTLDAGQIDCIWNGMTISDEVKTNCAVSKAYVKISHVPNMRV